MAADEEAARNEGFRRLARYIFGANHARQKIAMTAPVAQRREGDGGWVIRFFMPAKWTLDTLPGPDDERVELGGGAAGDRRGAAVQRKSWTRKSGHTHP